MKKLLFISAIGLLTACNFGSQDVVVVTATPPPVTDTPAPTPTDEPTATRTPRPTRTPVPTPTPAPTWPTYAVGDVEAGLRAGGYRRFPFTNDEGISGYFWVGSNAYEQVTTWEDGTLRFQVLHDSAVATRNQHMERHLGNLDGVLPPAFMAGLRVEFANYNRTVPSSVTGQPDELTAYGDAWNTVRGVYNVSYREVGGYQLEFSLVWLQSTCPPQYSYCYYQNFPGLEFTGDSSLIWETIMIWPPEDAGLPALNG